MGSIAPLEFIPFAEQNGLIVSIGKWVLRESLWQLKLWLDAGYAPFVMAINISAVEFRHADFIAQLDDILAEVKIDPQWIELEITEAVAMEKTLRSKQIIQQLSQRGIRLALDDFGTGYLSLSYLKAFSVHKLKIDQSFVREIEDDEGDRALVRAIIHMVKALDLITIAEGVENAAQLEFLQEEGCHEVQGYFYSNPRMPRA